MKITVAKVMAGGENVVVELSGSEKDIVKQLPVAFRIVDARLWEMNHRVLAMNEMYQKLVKESPAVALIVNDLLLQMTGQKVFEDKSVEAATTAYEVAKS